MPDANELALSLARIEGKIDATFSHLGSKVDEHDKLLLRLRKKKTKCSGKRTALSQNFYKRKLTVVSCVIPKQKQTT